MSSYFGTEEQQRLQRKAEGHASWAMRTPGACNAGRLLGTDDPDLLGWGLVFGHLSTDRAFAFRLLPSYRVLKASYRLDERGYGIRFWDVFQGNAERIVEATTPIIEQGLPEGYFAVGEDEIDDALVRQCQQCMLKNGVVPFYGALLAGRGGPSALAAVRDREGHIVATGFTHMPHNPSSPHRACAWGGLVAVESGDRGRRLGIAVNALLANRAVTKLGAERFYQLASPGNEISRRMIMRAGLHFDPDVKCGIALEMQRSKAG